MCSCVLNNFALQPEIEVILIEACMTLPTHILVSPLPFVLQIKYDCSQDLLHPNGNKYQIIKI